MSRGGPPSLLASSATRLHSAAPALHLFAHFWISWELGGVRHCQDGDWQGNPLSLTTALQSIQLQTLHFFFFVQMYLNVMCVYLLTCYYSISVQFPLSPRINEIWTSCHTVLWDVTASGWSVFVFGVTQLLGLVLQLWHHHWPLVSWISKSSVES